MGESSTVSFDSVNTALDPVIDALTSWAEGFLPIVATIAGAMLGFYLLKVAIRVIKGMTGSSK